MPARIFTTKEFGRFARKARISDADLVAIVERAESGLNDGELGGNLYKMRIGTRGAYRTILALVVEARAVYLLGYPKADLDNIGDATLATLKSAATDFLRLTDDEIDRLVNRGDLSEIPR